MSLELVVPDIGDFENVEVIEILVKKGDKINKNDPVITIESDKSSVEVPSNYEGLIENIKVKIGDKVSKGDLILTLSSSNVNWASIYGVFGVFSINPSWGRRYEISNDGCWIRNSFKYNS